mgnify:CR=1 FL=1
MRRVILLASMLTILLQPVGWAELVFKEHVLNVSGSPDETVEVPYTVVNSGETAENGFVLRPEKSMDALPEVSGTLNDQPAYAVDLSAMTPGWYSIPVGLYKSATGAKQDELEVNLLVINPEGPQSRSEAASMAQTIADETTESDFSDADGLISHVTQKATDLLGVEPELKSIDRPILKKIISGALETINNAESVEDEQSARQELDKILEEKFGGNSFRDVYAYDFLRRLGTEHWQNGNYREARRCYEQALPFLSDEPKWVLNTLSSMADTYLASLPDHADPIHTLAALQKHRQTLLRYFEYLPDETDEQGWKVYSSIASRNFWHFTRFLKYDNYRERFFRQTLTAAEKSRQLRDTAVAQRRYRRISAWELTHVKIEARGPDGNLLPASFTLTNVSPDTLYPRSDKRPDDTRTGRKAQGEWTLPVYAGHTYTLSVRAKVPGTDAYKVTMEQFEPQPGQHRIVRGPSSVESGTGDSAEQELLTFEFSPELHPVKEPSITIPASDGAGNVAHTFTISRREVRCEAFAAFLNDRDADGALSVSENEVSLSSGEPVCRLAEELSYDSSAEAGQRFSVSEDRRWHPARLVSWYGAAAYCNWKSREENLQPVYDSSTWEPSGEAGGYRLPTEAEWTKAATWNPQTERRTRYVNGRNTVEPEHANYLHENAPRDTMEAVSFPGVETPYGLHDTAGNVWEWSQTPLPDTDEQVYTVLGGSWASLRVDLQSGKSSAFRPEHMLPTVGFRIVKAAE